MLKISTTWVKMFEFYLRSPAAAEHQPFPDCGDSPTCWGQKPQHIRINTHSGSLSLLFMFGIMHCFKTNKKATVWCYLWNSTVWRFNICKTKYKLTRSFVCSKTGSPLIQRQDAQLFYFCFYREKNKTKPTTGTLVNSAFADRKRTGVSYRHLEIHCLTAN